ncbi:hypothetical protein P692DRAFT_20823894, partial [Suillus brevipes Sb2]
HAADLASSNPKPAEEIYKQILDSTDGDANGLAQVITHSRSFMSSTAKAKTAKLGERPLPHASNSIPNSRQTQIDVLTDNVEWSNREKRTFLKHSLENRFVSLPLEALQHKLALARIDAPLTELKSTLARESRLPWHWKPVEVQGYNAEPDVVDLFVKLGIVDRIGNIVDANAFGHVRAHVFKSFLNIPETLGVAIRLIMTLHSTNKASPPLATRYRGSSLLAFLLTRAQISADS